MTEPRHILLRCGQSTLIFQRMYEHYDCLCLIQFECHGEFIRHLWACLEIAQLGRIINIYLDFDGAVDNHIGDCVDISEPESPYSSSADYSTDSLASQDLSNPIQINIPLENAQAAVARSGQSMQRPLLPNALEANLNNDIRICSVAMQGLDMNTSGNVSLSRITHYHQRIQCQSQSQSQSQPQFPFQSRSEILEASSYAEKFIRFLEEEFPQHLDGVMANPLFSREAQEKYTKITDQIASVLNQKWDARGLIQYFSLRAFEGMMIVNEHHCACIQTVEFYHRNPELDKHHDKFENTGFTFPTRNSSVGVGILRIRGRSNLIVSTRIFNALVTSYLHTNIPGIKIGPIAPSEADYMYKDSQIFIRKEALDDLSQGIVTGRLPERVNQDRSVCQLRQVRSRFHELSTYWPLRSWGALLDQHLLPVTIWTLYLFPQRRSGSALLVASELFASIAREVWGKGPDATLTMEYVRSQVSKVTFRDRPGEICRGLQNVLGLFEGHDQMKIIGNKELNERLQEIAKAMGSALVRRNENIPKMIMI
ncbi:hypothetical protein BX616_004406 [Lobosporangium transversale]|uniref:Uncharacterized protein n=1 Tax=Lobosporangium transversale TaxID=64571 RepID=A0A1Y2GTV7_9FUNG|nr:hypothetical protein BCR41DRAFT_352008 [Lobosporangium transversale]KAF9898157.1 hypothetical protein BX616_004406 [Lobosporangium transversale]ORZ18234.1 hypothetical protein BCR41DRAFT_352008 [Lobosporangium transversale]|eukprot:XP_021882029.1 hypothetical protein BCR41DRAFT_352008 [Lobosporangium transversale]